MKIFNHAFMPRPGMYVMEQIDQKTFCKEVINVLPEEAIHAYIGTRRRDLIKKWIGVPLKACQEDIVLENNEVILVFEMNFKAKVKNETLYLPEYTFYKIQYKE